MHGKTRRRPVPWIRLTQISVIALAIVITAAGLRAIGDLAVPIAAALVTGLTLGPIADRLGRLGIPAVPMALILVFALVIGVLAILALISAPLASWIERAPEIGATLQRRLLALTEPLESLQRIENMIQSYFKSRQALSVEMAQPPIGQTIVATVSPALGQILIFVGTLLFMLIGRERMRRGVVLAFVGRDNRLTALKAITGIQQDLGRYFGTIALINAALGILTALVLLALGLDNPVLWGTLVFALNFIPFIGPIVAALLLVVGGLVTFESLTWCFMPAVAFLVLHGIESQFITPALLGHRFDINPLVVFLSIVFGAWMWGAPGAFLAVPILVMATSVWYRVTLYQADLLPD